MPQRRRTNLDRAVEALRHELPRDIRDWAVSLILAVAREERRALRNIGKPVIDIDRDVTKGAG
jgi:hypothetical protein